MVVYRHTASALPSGWDPDMTWGIMGCSKGRSDALTAGSVKLLYAPGSNCSQWPRRLVLGHMKSQQISALSLHADRSVERTSKWSTLKVKGKGFTQHTGEISTSCSFATATVGGHSAHYFICLMLYLHSKHRDSCHLICFSHQPWLWLPDKV